MFNMKNNFYKVFHLHRGGLEGGRGGGGWLEGGGGGGGGVLPGVAALPLQVIPGRGGGYNADLRVVDIFILRGHTPQLLYAICFLTQKKCHFLGGAEGTLWPIDMKC